MISMPMNSMSRCIGVQAMVLMSSMPMHFVLMKSMPMPMLPDAFGADDSLMILMNTMPMLQHAEEMISMNSISESITLMVSKIINFGTGASPALGRQGNPGTGR